MKKPDLGKDLIGIDYIRYDVSTIIGERPEGYYDDILENVLWILDDYKRLKKKELKNAKSKSDKKVRKDS